MIIEDGSTFHACWQCHNKDWLLGDDWSKETYYKLLLRYKDRYGIQIYSYCFMSNHPHLTGRVEQKENLSHFFRIVNAMFARAYNKRHGRRGQESWSGSSRRASKPTQICCEERRKWFRGSILEY